MKKEGHLIQNIVPGSIAQEMEIEAGDLLLSIDGKEVEDIFDYQYMTTEEHLEVLIRKKDGEEWLLEIEKDPEEDLGLMFASGLMDDYRSCSNKCVFCFIDQMPPGMRPTLYFKDDDSRLSFLQGNYITLTNLSQKDLDRIIRYHLSPINISFHTMNPALRCEMLHNRFAGEALKKVDPLFEAGIEMNGQIVLCKGINDGNELEYSIREMMKYLPHLRSVSVVPVGLTKYRDHLPKLESFGPEECGEVIDLIEKYQKICFEKHGLHFIHASDEFYLTAGRPMPEEARYDGFLQLGNGVGMVRLMENEFDKDLKARLESGVRPEPIELSAICGTLIYPVIRKMADRIMECYPEARLHIYPIRNDFFGPTITVTGLLTGRDICAQLQGKPLGKVLLLPENVLRAGEEILLDDMTRAQLSDALQVPVHTIKSGGYDLLDLIFDANWDKRS